MPQSILQSKSLTAMHKYEWRINEIKHVRTASVTWGVKTEHANLKRIKPAKEYIISGRKSHKGTRYQDILTDCQSLSNFDFDTLQNVPAKSNARAFGEH
jgi:hypothetical protein